MDDERFVLQPRGIKPIRHGSPYSYGNGCRCLPCTVAWREFRRPRERARRMRLKAAREQQRGDGN